MDVKFICYEKATGKVFVMLDSEPDNSDYSTTNKIMFDGRIRARGINWTNAGYHIFTDPVEWSGREFQTLFDEQSKTLSIDSNWQEPNI